jgi:hypothetical protein
MSLLVWKVSDSDFIVMNYVSLNMHWNWHVLNDKLIMKLIEVREMGAVVWEF